MSTILPSLRGAINLPWFTGETVNWTSTEGPDEKSLPLGRSQLLGPYLVPDHGVCMGSQKQRDESLVLHLACVMQGSVAILKHKGPTLQFTGQAGHRPWHSLLEQLFTFCRRQLTKASLLASYGPLYLLYYKHFLLFLTMYIKIQ